MLYWYMERLFNYDAHGISGPVGKRRDKLFIISEILEITREGSLKTQVMYRANLSFTQLNDYLNFMLKTNFLKKTSVAGKDVYGATDKGLDFLDRYRETTELLMEEKDPASIHVRIGNDDKHKTIVPASKKTQTS